MKRTYRHLDPASLGDLADASLFPTPEGAARPLATVVLPLAKEAGRRDLALSSLMVSETKDRCLGFCQQALGGQSPGETPAYVSAMGLLFDVSINGKTPSLLTAAAVFTDPTPKAKPSWLPHGHTTVVPLPLRLVDRGEVRSVDALPIRVKTRGARQTDVGEAMDRYVGMTSPTLAGMPTAAAEMAKEPLPHDVGVAALAGAVFLHPAAFGGQSAARALVAWREVIVERVTRKQDATIADFLSVVTQALAGSWVGKAHVLAAVNGTLLREIAMRRPVPAKPK